MGAYPCGPHCCDPLPCECNVSFSITPLAEREPECKTILFTDTSVLTNCAPIVEWHWYFGDGAESFDQNPTHTYATNGRWLIRLRIETEDGTVCWGEKYHDVCFICPYCFVTPDQMVVSFHNMWYCDAYFNTDGPNINGQSFVLDPCYDVTTIPAQQDACGWSYFDGSQKVEVIIARPDLPYYAVSYMWLDGGVDPEFGSPTGWRVFYGRITIPNRPDCDDENLVVWADGSQFCGASAWVYDKCDHGLGVRLSMRKGYQDYTVGTDPDPPQSYAVLTSIFF